MHATIKDALGLGKIPVSELKARALSREQVFRGYIAEYFYLPVSGSEVSFSQYHTEWNRDRSPANFHDGWTAYGHQSSSYWRVICTSFPRPVDYDLASPVYVEANPFIAEDLAGAMVPLRLMHPNVRGLLRFRSEMLLQVAFVAADIRIQRFEADHPPFTLEALYQWTPETKDKDVTLCRLRAPITQVGLAEKTGCEFEHELHLRVGTPYGSLDVFYTGPDAKALHDAMEGPVCVDAAGWLVGDCATGRFQTGTKRDKLHLLEAVACAQDNGYFKTVTPVLDPDAKLYAEGELQAEGDANAVNWLREHTSWKTDTGIAHNPRFSRRWDKESRTSVPGIALRYNDDSDHFLVLEADCTDRGLISALRLRRESKDNIEIFASFEEWENDSPVCFPREIRVARAESLAEVWRSLPEKDLAAISATTGESWRFEKHAPSFEEPLGALMLLGANPKKTLSEALSSHLRLAYDGIKGKALYETEDGRPGFFFPMTLPGERKNASLDIPEIIPKLPGILCPEKAEILAIYLPSGSTAGELAVRFPSRPEPVIFCVPDLAAHDCNPGEEVQLELSGVLLELDRREPEPITVSEGDYYELCLKEFLESNPGKTKADFPSATVYTDSLHMMTPEEYGAYFGLVGNVESVSETDLFGAPVLAMETPLLIGYSLTVMIRLYARKNLLKEDLKPGDSFTCAFFGLARIR